MSRETPFQAKPKALECAEISPQLSMEQTISPTTPSTHRILPGAGRALALLLAINLFNYIDRNILAAVEPLISDHFFGVADETAQTKTGFLAFFFLLSYMVLAPVFGALSDRYSRWMIIAAGVGVWSLASGWSGLSTTFAMLIVSRICVGVGEAAYGPAAPTIISDMYPIERRGLMLSFFYLAIPVGSALGYIIGGKLGGQFGWRAPFYAVVAPGLILATVCLFMRDPRTLLAPSQTVRKPKIDWHAIAGLIRIKSYVLNTAAMTAMTFAIGGIAFWLPRYLYKDRASEFTVGPELLAHINQTFGIITVVAGLSATLIGGWCGDLVRRKFPSAYFLVSGIAMLFAFPATVAMLKTPFPTAWVLVFLAEFFLFFNTGPGNTALANVTSPAVRSTAFALNIFLIHAFGDAISPPLIGWIAGQTSMKFAFIIVSATMVLASAFWLIGVKYLPRDTEAVERMTEESAG
jgi:MFS transporter, Spinster family, sphingosine-1-phosphate transporter